MALPAFNTTAHGSGLEGFLNWTNILSNGLMMNFFVVFIALGIYFVSQKSGIAKNIALALAGISVIIITPILQLFTTVNPQLVIFGLLALAFGVGGHFLGK